MPPYSGRASTLRESPTRRIDALRERLEREGRDVILLSTGQPGVPPPEWLREEAARLAREGGMGVYGYTPSGGYWRLRELIALDVGELGGPELDPRQVVVTAGGQAAMYAALAAIVPEGGEVVLLDPTYFGYEPLVRHFGGRVRWVPVRAEEGYQPDPDRVLEAVERGRTSAIVLVTPDNPTGRLLSRSAARALAEIAEDYDLWLVADEAYKTLVYEGEHVWLYSLDPERVVSVNTFSKDPGMPGWRLGYVYGPRWIVGKIHLIHESLVYCPPSIAQRTIMAYLSRREERLRHVEWLRGHYRVRRDALLEEAARRLPRARLARPQGGMFAFLDLRRYLEPLGVDAERLAELLLEREGVAAVPGTYFGTSHPYALRLSFSTETPERIREGVARIARLLGDLEGEAKAPG
ncbi:MAG: pyridoxal phosphate-dependent aminotransferase [Desulfurococcales archaeon]|nr:pyridoxal phosphate-dependent aminotransferase [Desulfurococcales archaeon]